MGTTLIYDEISSNLNRMGLNCVARQSWHVYQVEGHRISTNFTIPDVAVININPKEKVVFNGHYCGVPQLVIEVMSNNKRNDLKYKLLEYAGIGMSEYWVVDINNFMLLQFILDETGEYNAGIIRCNKGVIKHHLCGLELDLGKLFQELKKCMESLGAGDDGFQGTILS